MLTYICQFDLSLTRDTKKSHIWNLNIYHVDNIAITPAKTYYADIKCGVTDKQLPPVDRSIRIPLGKPLEIIFGLYNRDGSGRPTTNR
eukprot:UN00265